MAPDSPLATSLAKQRNTLRLLPYSDAVCECSRSVSPPNDPSKNRPAAALGHTMSKHASVLMLQPDMYMDHQR